LEYSAGYPKRFNSFEDAPAFCREFTEEYNNHMYHSSLAMLTPSMVHHGIAQEVISQRQNALDAAFAEHPGRFVNGAPTHQQLPQEVWINKPENEPNVVAIS